MTRGWFFDIIIAMIEVKNFNFMNQYQVKARQVKRIVAEGRKLLDDFGQEYLESIQKLLEKAKNERATKIKKHRE